MNPLAQAKGEAEEANACDTRHHSLFPSAPTSSLSPAQSFFCVFGSQAEDRALSNKNWYVVDAEGLRLGRMASEVAKLLLGKHKATFTPGADVGDYVIIVNAEKARSPIPRQALNHSSFVPHSSHAYTAASCPTARSNTCPCSQVIVTGKKYEQKLYRRHSGRPGGMKIENFEELQKRIPERIVEKVACLTHDIESCRASCACGS